MGWDTWYTMISAGHLHKSRKKTSKTRKICKIEFHSIADVRMWIIGVKYLFTKLTLSDEDERENLWYLIYIYMYNLIQQEYRYFKKTWNIIYLLRCWFYWWEPRSLSCFRYILRNKAISWNSRHSLSN